MSENNFVAMGKCRFCGGDSGEILINQRLKEIKPEEAYSGNPCPECEKRFKDHKFFFADCGHQGFIKTEAFEKILPATFVHEVGKGKIFRMEKCFMCMGMIKEKDCKKI